MVISAAAHLVLPAVADGVGFVTVAGDDDEDTAIPVALIGLTDGDTIADADSEAEARSAAGPGGGGGS